MQPMSANRAMTSKSPVEHDLCARVWAEFHEMPGLDLTLPQAARLFSLDLAHCARGSTRWSSVVCWPPMASGLRAQIPAGVVPRGRGP